MSEILNKCVQRRLWKYTRGIYKENGMKGVHLKRCAYEASNGLNVNF
jgi:hypothetical protein